MKTKLATLIILLIFSIGSKPDLVCTKVELINKRPKVNDKISLSFSIFNLGDEKVSDNYDVSLFINDSLVSTDTEGSPLKPRQGITYSKLLDKGFYHFIPKKAGSYNYKVIIDSQNLIDEKDEENNTKEGSFIVFNN